MIESQKIENVIILLIVAAIGAVIGFLFGDYKSSWTNSIEERLEKVEVIHAAMKGDTTIIEKAYVDIHSESVYVVTPAYGGPKPYKLPKNEISFTKSHPTVREAIDLHWKMNFGRFR